MQLCVDSGGNSALDITARIIEQYFVVADVDAHLRQSGKPRIERRSARILRIGSPQIGVHQFRHLWTGEIRIG
jgi:hypothetical protein